MGPRVEYRSTLPYLVLDFNGCSRANRPTKILEGEGSMAN